MKAIHTLCLLCVLNSSVFAAKQPLPSGADQQAGQATVREIFKSQLSAARTAASKKSLAQTFLLHAADSADDPGAGFALLTMARDLSIEAGEMSSALSAVDAIVARFEVNQWQVRHDCLKALAPRVTDRSAFVVKALELVDEAVADGQFDVANRAGMIAYTVARRAGDRELLKRVSARRREIRQLNVESQKMSKAREAIRADPGDQTAHLILAKWHCFRQGDWSEGIPHLVRCGDPGLKKLGELETAGAETADQQLRLADSWWNFAERAGPMDKTGARLRAGHWYRTVLPQLKGLARTKAQVRMDAIGDIPVAATKPAKDEKEKTPASNRGLIGRAKIGGEDLGVAFRYHTGKTFRESVVRDEMVKAKLNGSIKIELKGFLKVPRDMEILIWHAGGSSSGGRVYIHVDGKKIGGVGDDMGKNSVHRFGKSKGVYPIRWQLTGGHLANCYLEFLDPESKQPLQVAHSLDLLRETNAKQLRGIVDNSAESKPKKPSALK